MYSIVIDLLPAFLAPFWSCWPLKEENADAPDELRATAAVRTKAVDFMVDSGSWLQIYATRNIMIRSRSLLGLY